MSDRQDHDDHSDTKRKAAAAVAAAAGAAVIASAIISGTESEDTEAATGTAPPHTGARDPFDELVPPAAAAPAPPVDVQVPAAPAAPAATGDGAPVIADDPSTVSPIDAVEVPSSAAEPVAATAEVPPAAEAAVVPNVPDDAPTSSLSTEPLVDEPDVLQTGDVSWSGGAGEGEPDPAPGIPAFMEAPVAAAAPVFVVDVEPADVVTTPPASPAGVVTPPPGFARPPSGMNTGGAGGPLAEQAHQPLNDVAAMQAAQAVQHAHAQAAAAAAAQQAGDGLPPGQPEQVFVIDAVVVAEGDPLPTLPPLAPGQEAPTAPVADLGTPLDRYGDIPLNQLDAEDFAEVKAALGLTGPRGLQGFMQDGSTLAEVFEASHIDINVALAGVDIDIPTFTDQVVADGTVGGTGPGGVLGGGVTTDHTDYGNVLPAPPPPHFVPWDTIIVEDHSTPQLDDNGFGAVGDSGQQIQWPDEFTI